MPPYRVPFFVKLSEYFELKVLFSDFENMDSNRIRNYEDIFICVGKRRFLNRFDFLRVSEFIKRYKPSVIVVEYSNFNLNLFSYLLKPRNFKLLVWGHCYHRGDKSGHRYLPNLIKYYVAKSSDAIIAYTKGGKNFLTKMGCDKSKIFVAWNAILFEKKPLDENIIQAKFNSRRFVFIARLIEEKKPELACQIIKKLNENNIKDPYHLDIIGGGKLLEHLKVKYSNYPYINFHGAIIDESKIGSISLYSFALINPGYLGLNIVHALVYGLPIISVKDGVESVFHSPEFEYIDNKPCFIGNETDETSEYLKNIIMLANDFGRYRSSVQNTQVALSSISLENMVGGFVKALNYTQK